MMTRSRLTYLALVVALIGGALLLRYEDPFFVRALRLIAFDHFQRLDPPKYDPNLPIRIVDIDEESLAKIGQWPWPRTTVRDLLAELAAKGAAVVAFDVLFAEPDRTSLEAIVKQLPASQAAAVTAAMAGRPSNDQQFADEIKQTPTVLSIVLGQGTATTLPAKAGFVFGGDDPRPFLQEFDVATPNLPQFEEAAHGIGAFNWVADRDQIVRRVALMFRLNDIVRAVARRGSPAHRPRRLDLPFEGIKRQWRDRFRTIHRPQPHPHRRHHCADRWCWRGLSQIPPLQQGGVYPGLEGVGRRGFARTTSRDGSFLSAPALLACSTCGQPRSMPRCRGSMFTPRCSSTC